LPGDHRKVYANRSEADFVMPSGIITTYLRLRQIRIGQGHSVASDREAPAGDGAVTGQVEDDVQKTNLLRCSHPLDSFG
jgi:hypothetical protein